MILYVFSNILLKGIEGLARLKAIINNTNNISRVIANGPEILKSILTEYNFAKTVINETI